MGAYNADDTERWIYVDDADSVARRVVVACSLAPPHNTGEPVEQEDIPVERVLTGLRFGAVCRIVERVYGRAFEALSGGVWLRRLREKAGDGEGGERGGSLLLPVLHLLEREGGRVGVDVNAEAVHDEGDCGGVLQEETERVEELVQGNVRWLIRTGALPGIET